MNENTSWASNISCNFYESWYKMCFFYGSQSKKFEGPLLEIRDVLIRSRKYGKVEKFGVRWLIEFRTCCFWNADEDTQQPIKPVSLTTERCQAGSTPNQGGASSRGQQNKYQGNAYLNAKLIPQLRMALRARRKRNSPTRVERAQITFGDGEKIESKPGREKKRCPEAKKTYSNSKENSFAWTQTSGKGYWEVIIICYWLR